MADLRQRLQAALGDAYRIERELGGGGMSRVFLAQETALKRRVVIKVLPPEMAAGVNVERFRREIELAASLQHPHIVPLLSAGSSGDLLYYVMPYVEGESLRAKLAREGELAIGETLRILKEIVDALAYAHAQGVVHRDIKPENVLIARKHAVVTDFGVAKAMTASTGGGSLTSLGVALGTPAYMAPEQAAADPHVDHRADLYATGVVGYEMLCGRPPFLAATPQATLAAQVTQMPAPVTTHRPSVPEALGALIMRCLEKHPADRWENADELLHQLEAMATPSGGMTPTGAGAPISSGTEAAIRRTHPVRVVVLFGTASLVMLGLVYLLMLKLGLPSWVFAGAVALLVVGLPIMLVTGVFERRRALARTTSTAVPTPQGLRRWFTWRRSLLGGAAAFSGLGIATAVYMAMRLLGIGPVGTLVASGVLKERERVVLANFQNRATDSTLGPSLSEAFRIDLSQSPTVKLVDAQAVTEALQRMNRAPGTVLDPALAREIAVRLGIKAVLTGQIDPVGGGYVLSATLVSAADGQVLAGVRETAENDAALIPAIDHLSKRLRERIGESLRTIRANEPLEKVTTTSLAALRKYSEGVYAHDVRGDFEEAASLLEDATALDTGFAMAYRKLAMALGNSGAARVRWVPALTKAFDHRDRMPELERYITIATYYSDVDYDLPKSIAANRSALQLDPDNRIALLNLAIALLLQRKWAEAESLAVRAMPLGNPWMATQEVMWAQVAQGRLADAHATLDRYAQNAPHNPFVSNFRAALAAGTHDYAAAERAIVQLREEQRASPSWKAGTSIWLAALDEVRGKLARAEEHARDYMAESEQRGLPGDYVNGAVQLAWLDLHYRNRASTALKTVDAALKRHPLATIPAVDRPYTALAGFFAHAGRSEQAKRLLAEFETSLAEGIRRGDFGRYAAAGQVAMAEGRPHDAIGAYRALYDGSGCATCGLFEIATAYDRTQQADSSLATYERVVSTHGLWRLFDDSYALAPSLKRLGELYEARGDRPKALDYYGRFVDLWKDADPELQPIVKDVRARLARLGREH